MDPCSVSPISISVNGTTHWVKVVTTSRPCPPAACEIITEQTLSKEKEANVKEVVSRQTVGRFLVADIYHGLVSEVC
jgi:hypothetical protein